MRVKILFMVFNHLMDVRTICLPKKLDATDFVDFCTITISSTLARLFQRILAKRINSVVEFSKRQKNCNRASIDCCRDNIVIDHLLRLLPRECGLRFGDIIVRAMVFDNDMNSIAEAPQGI